eukprot:SAG11_NODE_432_length_9520_cov_102.527863_8_plen_74_part_00
MENVTCLFTTATLNPAEHCRKDCHFPPRDAARHSCVSVDERAVRARPRASRRPHTQRRLMRRFQILLHSSPDV